jgi:dehydrogenase/reductase SDR family protein 1
MTQLRGRVCVVTGASRGIGKGIALALGAAGATVYVTGRSLRSTDDSRGSLSSTVEQITAMGGIGISVQCDHSIDSEVQAVIRRIREEQGRLDLLVNNVMSTPQRFELPNGIDSFWDLHPFWEVPPNFWDAFHNVGLRSHYVASVYAAPLLIATGGSLIVNVSSVGASRYVGNVAYGVGKAAVDRLASDMAEELRPRNVASVALWPGFTRTEDVVGQVETYPDLAGSTSPLFNGRAVVALATDPQVMVKSGQRFRVVDLAAEYGFVDEPSDAMR